MTDTSTARELAALTEVGDLRSALTRAQEQLRQAKAKTDQLVDAVHAAAKDAILATGPPPPVPAPKRDARKRKPEVAVWHLTDWQGAKLTTSYNTEVMRERVLRYCDKAERLTEIQRTDHPVRDCVILFGGDMIEGLFNFPSQPFEIDATIFGQYSAVGNLAAEVVRRALSLYENVTVVSEWGNHGRIGSKRSAVPPSDNFDRMVYHLSRAWLTDLDGKLHSRLTWEDSEEDVRKVVIGNYRALLVHGDEVGRNGFASPQTIQQHIARWQSGAMDFEFTDVYSGHFHEHEERALPNGLGSWWRTGSPESDNRYAGISMASSARPSQRINFIDPESGRVTVPCKVWLDA